MSNTFRSRREVLALSDVSQSAYITLQGAARLTGLGAPMLLKLGLVDSTFPRLIVVTPHKRLYQVDELLAWMESRRGREPLSLHAPKSAARRKPQRG